MIDIPVTIEPSKPELKPIKELCITLTDAAADRILELQEQMPEDKLQWLRLEVKAGGCAGYQYSFYHDQLFTEGLREDDDIVFIGRAAIVIDLQSANLIKGATIDYVSELTSSQFVVNIPNSTTCGCGVSFQL